VSKNKKMSAKKGLKAIRSWLTHDYTVEDMEVQGFCGIFIDYIGFKSNEDILKALNLFVLEDNEYDADPYLNIFLKSSQKYKGEESLKKKLKFTFNPAKIYITKRTPENKLQMSSKCIPVENPFNVETPNLKYYYICYASPWAGDDDYMRGITVVSKIIKQEGSIS
jgi:hypothetical protein